MPDALSSNELPGENTASSAVDPSTPPDAISSLRDAAALNELQHLREDLAARDVRIAELQRSISQLESQLATLAPQPAGAAARHRGAQSPRIGADDQGTRARAVDHAAVHATATGKRRDLLDYLRLRRRKP